MAWRKTPVEAGKLVDRMPSAAHCHRQAGVAAESIAKSQLSESRQRNGSVCQACAYVLLET
jgi:hypothetical protein